MTNLERVTKKSHFASHSITVWSGHSVVGWVWVFDVSVCVGRQEVSWRPVAMTHSFMLYCTRIASRRDTVPGPK